MGQTTWRHALVTGASSGIGAAFAHHLAAEGTALTLTARRTDTLQETAEACRHAGSAQVHILPADLADPEAVQRLCATLPDTPPIDLFIHAAGFGTLGKFAASDLPAQLAMLHLHNHAGLALAHTLLPGMLARRHGGMILLGSLSAWIPLAGNATYAATKRFWVTWVACMARELAGSGVRVTALCPGYTRTGFHAGEAFRKFDAGRVPDSWWMTPEAVVADGLRALGRGMVVRIPGWRNRMLARLAGCPLTRGLIQRMIR